MFSPQTRTVPNDPAPQSITYRNPEPASQTVAAPQGVSRSADPGNSLNKPLPSTNDPPLGIPATTAASATQAGSPSFVPSNSLAPQAITLAGQAYTGNVLSGFIAGSLTLTAGGVVTITGVPISLATDASYAVYGTSTIVLPSPSAIPPAPTDSSITPILLQDQPGVVYDDAERFSPLMNLSNLPPSAALGTCLFTKCVDEGPLIFLLLVYWLFFVLTALPATLFAYCFCNCPTCKGRRNRGRVFSAGIKKRIAIRLVRLSLKKRPLPDPAETEPAKVLRAKEARDEPRWTST